MNQLTEPAKVAPKLIQKLNVNAPSKLLVEKYLIEICRCANVPFEADEKIMREDDDEIALAEKNLNNFLSDSSVASQPISQNDTIGWASGHGSDFFDIPGVPNHPINKGPNDGSSNSGGGGMTQPINYPTPTQMAPTLPPMAPPTNMAMAPPPVYPHPQCQAPHAIPPSFVPPQAPMGHNVYSEPTHRPPSTASAPEPDHIYEEPPASFDFNLPEPPKDFPSKKG
uniref:Uncharacterized protein n=1 Tax=Panagrolaimus sp. JU765 TaxID=591449 RepID=A0AC34QB53_9BILA